MMNSNSKLPKCITLYSSWSNLPPDLLELIANRLENEDVMNLLAVCKSWNSSLLANPITIPPLNPSPVNIPFMSQLMSLLYGYEGPTNHLLVVSSVDVYILRPSNSDGNWLVGAEQLSSGKVRLVHPLTRVPIDKNALGNGKLPQLVRKLRPLKVSTRTSYNLSFPNDAPITDKQARKVIYLKNSDLNKSPNVPDGFGSLIVLFQDGTLSKWDNNWPKGKAIESFQISKSFDDMIMLRDSIVAVDKKRRLISIEPETMMMTNLLAGYSDIDDNIDRHRLGNRLLEWNGDLYLVVKKQSSSIRRTKRQSSSFSFEVHVLDCPNIMSSSWMKLTTLGDRVLFVGLDDCFFVESNDLGLPGRISGNCIVFTTHCFPSRNKDLFKKAPNEYLQIGVYDYDGSNNFRLLSSDSALCTAFWPPPRLIFEPNDGDRPFSANVTKADKTPELEVKTAKKRKGKQKISSQLCRIERSLEPRNSCN